MPRTSLVDLRTDLKSLKYGQDRLGGGSSGQPYITQNIPDVVVPSFMDDGFIRGGAVRAGLSSANDSVRIFKFFRELPKGTLFIAKQIGLQLSNPKPETAPGGGFFQPTRTYNGGINTLLQIPVVAFGGHLNRHGLLPVQPNSTKYLAIAQSNNQNFGANNRLVLLKNKLIKPASVSSVISGVTSILGSLIGLINPSSPIPSLLQPPDQVIYNYSGGPSSVYGVGTTLIRRYDNTSNGLLLIPILNTKGVTTNIRANYRYATPISIAYGAATNMSTISKNAVKYTQDIQAGDNGTSISPTTRKYSELKKVTDNQSVNSTKAIFKFNPLKNTALGAAGFDFYNATINSYTNNAVSYNNGLNTVRLDGTWATLNRERRVGSGKTDDINLTPLLENLPAGTLIDVANGRNINDLVKFRIQSLNYDDPTKATWMIFRAYITDLSDATNATWNETKYTGRGESFFTYGGFSRTINIGFKVAALSEKEMQPMYQKLNYLMGNLMPDYGKDGLLMRGPFVKMTVGNWIDGQDGILKDLTYSIPNDSPWEIGLKVNGGLEPLILPHIVEVKMTFTPIGSQTKNKNLISKKSTSTSHIAQNVNNERQYIFPPTTTNLAVSALAGG